MSSTFQGIAQSAWFQRLILLTILIAGALVGVETYPQFQHFSVLHVLDRVVLFIFVIEIVVKMGAEGRQPWRYFRDPWNIFDFIIVAAGFLPVNAQFVTAFRLLRLLRVLKLVRSLPRLQILVDALLKSIPSMFYIGILLSLLFYLYAVTGTILFGANDPINFGELGVTLLSLFEIVTMEGWVDVMLIQQHGCDAPGFGYDDALMSYCTQPQAHYFIAPVYFVTFILIGTMVVMNLFIGVIINSMEESQAEEKELAMADRRLKEGRNMAMELDDMQVLLEKLQEQLARARSQGRENAALLEERNALHQEVQTLRGLLHQRSEGHRG